MESRDISGNYQFGNIDEQFQIHDLINDANFEQFIDLIRGETADPIVSFCPDYDCQHITGCLYDNQFGPVTGNLFDFNSAPPPEPQQPLPPPPPLPPVQAYVATSSFTSALNDLPAIDLGLMDEDDDENDEGSSANTTTTTNTTPTKKKADRSKTLVSERRRRGRMKEKLYALRALVPNITKMDKASIVGDAVMYVQDLQIQAKKLRAEIAGLESSMTTKGERHPRGLVDHQKTMKLPINYYPTVCKNITKMEMFQVEERGFYVKVESNRGPGVAISLYKALESLARFRVQSSNLATLEDRFALTFTMKVKESEPDMNLPNTKLWVTGALLNQGFEFLPQPSA